jgi:hypothetical protein
VYSAPYCFPILSKFGVLSIGIRNVPNIKFHENTSSESRADKCGRTDITKLIEAFFAIYGNVYKISEFCSHSVFIF